MREELNSCTWGRRGHHPPPGQGGLQRRGDLGWGASSNIISMGIEDVHEEDSPGGDKLEEQSGAGRQLGSIPLGLDQRQ